MLTAEENELLTRVGRGTPLGETMRRYWIPALLSGELDEPDCPPVRVKLLGENLVAFRDTSGRIGLLEEFCAHRQASLFFGRNKECGLRCVYHGWKYDVDGNCVDMMNEPEELNFKSKIQLTSYPAFEAGEIIWAYMGPSDDMPPPPKFAWTQAAESHRHVSKVVEECNWLQGLEGGLDTSHAPILHRMFKADSGMQGISPNSPIFRGKAPTLEVDLTDYGYRYFGVRELGEAETYIRGYHFVLPFHQMRPQPRDEADHVAGHIWVPMDDGNTMVYNWVYSISDEPLNEEDRLERWLGNGPLDVDQKNGYRSVRNRDNNFMMDRQVQKYETFTGIEGINCQDRAIQESMGPITDRTVEHLGPADTAIIQARKLILGAISTVQDGGAPPGTGASYYNIRAIDKVLPAKVDWRAAVIPIMDPAAV